MAVLLTMQGTVRDDGTLELEERVLMPPGKVLVTVQPIVQPPPDDPFWQAMERIWAEQKARGHVPRTKEQIDADIQELRDEWEEHQRAIERLQEECWRSRNQGKPSTEPGA